MEKESGRRIILATLSNGSLRLLVDLVRSRIALVNFSCPDLSTLPNLASLPDLSGSLGDPRQARHADLPYDTVFSGDLLKAYKPNPKMYLGACSLLSLQPSEVAMVAAHIYDLRSAAANGMRTIYIPRETEDLDEDQSKIKGKHEGGEVDVVCKDLGELRGLFE